MGLKIKGMGSVVEDMSIMLSRMENNAILEAGAQPLLEQMKRNATTDPKKRSGRLVDALNVQAHGNSITVGVHRNDWHGDDFYYPAAVEYGHGGPHPAPPHPFIRPAVDSRGEEALDNIKNKLKQALK